jgi:lysozyme family protein
MTLDELAPEYRSRLDVMKFTSPTFSNPQKSADAVAIGLLKNRGRFLALQTQCGVPALWVMATFEREGPDFACYLGNGDPLDKKTTHEPHGRGPFSSWELGAADALHLDSVTACSEWTWEAACYEWEKWNGFGPRTHGRTSGYLWSGTDQYHGGKYVSDGVWSRGTWDKQLGTVIIAKTIASMDAEIAKGFTS